MAIKVEKALEQSQHVTTEDLPPLTVTTQGIPDLEHVEVAVPTEGVQGSARERRRRLFTWALAGVLGLLLVVAGILSVVAWQPPTGPEELHMGLTTQAWQEFRAGERASGAMGHMGLTALAWQEFRAGERASSAMGHMGLTAPAWQEYRSGERA